MRHRKPGRWLTLPLALLVSYTLTSAAAEEQAHGGTQAPKVQVLAPGYQTLRFTAPVAGSYSLPVLGNAGDGEVLLSTGEAVPLHSLLGDRYVLLSFIYTRCSDVNGCPLATFVTSKVRQAVQKSELLRDQVRFVSLSFDPFNDTPEYMDKYARSFVRADFDWQFLTTASVAELDPILDLYNQSVLRELDENGQPSGAISHILRVYLIDRNKQLRNIYSTSFLHPTTVLHDLETLALADQATQETAITTPTAKPLPRLHGAGDYKGGYDSKAYETRSTSLEQRSGKPFDLLGNALKKVHGLPRQSVSVRKSLSKAKIALGRKLFFDRRLSLNNTFSCAMCHIPEQGFTSNELQTAVGFEGRTVRRNAPSLYNVSYMPRLFHDGREDKLTQQIWSPLLAANEMANPSVAYVLNKVNRLPEYQRAFSKAYKSDAATMQTLGEALAAYQSSLIAANSPFDRWRYGNDESALSPEAKRGFELFTGKAACSACHTIGEKFALFSNSELHNTGIGYAKSMQSDPAQRKVLLAPGVWIDVDTSAIADSSEATISDLGLYEITQDPADRWKYRTPSLRNIALSPPYMHDGSLSTLRAVVEFYNRGGVSNPILDPLVRPLGLSSAEIDQLVAFLNALTGDSVDALISDAFAAETGNVE